MALVAWAIQPHDGFTQINFRFWKKRWTAIFNTERTLVFLWCPMDPKNRISPLLAHDEAHRYYGLVQEQRLKRDGG